MNITLRKASALQQAIQDTIRNIDINVKVSLNEFENTTEILDKANSELINKDQRRKALTQALYNIRALVGQANATSGINERLASAAYIDKRIGQLNDLVQSSALRDSMVVVEGKVAKLKAQPTDTARSRLYGYDDTISTGVLVEAQASAFKSEQLGLKKEKQKINDEVLELNVRTEITIGEITRSVLEQEGLL